MYIFIYFIIIIYFIFYFILFYFYLTWSKLHVDSMHSSTVHLGHMQCLVCFCDLPLDLGPVLETHPNRKSHTIIESTHKGVNHRSKYVTRVQQQRPESPTVTLTWHACKYKVHKLPQRHILFFSFLLLLFFLSFLLLLLLLLFFTL